MKVTTHTVIFLLAINIIMIMSSHAFETPLSRESFAHFYGLKSPNHLLLLNVSGYQQTEDYTCGPAVVMSLLRYYGMLSDKQMNKSTELQIAKQLGTTIEKGTSPQQLVSWFTNHGFVVKYGENGTLSMLKNNLKRGIPTLVEWIDWGGHWTITMGYDTGSASPADDKDTIFFADPSAHFDNVKYTNGITYFNADRFDSMWFDAQYFKPGHLVKGIYIVAVPKVRGSVRD